VLTPWLVGSLKAKKYVLQQDGASYHTAEEVKKFCEKQGLEVLQGWPAHSPDLNPIEQVWALLNQKIAEYHPTTLQQLREATVAAWKAIPRETLNSYHTSFLKKLAKIVNTG